MSPSLKHHFAALNLAVLDYPTYRIPVSGTEGCFNDLRNDCPATLYLRVAGSGVSCLLGFWWRSQCHSVAGTSRNLLSALCGNLSRTVLSLSGPLGTSPTSPPPGWPTSLHIPPLLWRGQLVNVSAPGRSLTSISLPLWCPLSGWAGIILTIRCNSYWWRFWSM